MELDLGKLDEDSAAVAVVALLAELATARTNMESWQRRAAGLRKMIDGLVEMYPSTEDELPDDLDEDEAPRPRGAEAVRRVLEMNVGKWYPVSAIVHLLGQQGWLPASSNPSNAVRTAAERLVELDAIKKDRSVKGEVIYQFATIYGDEEPF